MFESLKKPLHYCHSYAISENEPYQLLCKEHCIKCLLRLLLCCSKRSERLDFEEEYEVLLVSKSEHGYRLLNHHKLGP